MATGAKRQRYGLLLVPDFSLIALSSVVDPLRLANAALGANAYEYAILAETRDAVASSDGIRVLPDADLAERGRYDAVFVFGPNPIPAAADPALSAWLRRQAARGAAMAGVDTGAYLLAQAGLLDGYRCTIHWEDRDALTERFPRLQVTNRLVEVDRDRYTCSGGVSPVDMMLVLLGRPPGSRALAAQVSDLLVAAQRSPDEPQTVPLRHRLRALPETVREVLEIMENNVEEPLAADELAAHAGVSRRTLERLFRTTLGVSPAKCYLRLRLERARLAILRGNRALDDVAQSTGFASTSHFIARYRCAFGRTPAAERAAAQKRRPVAQLR